MHATQSYTPHVQRRREIKAIRRSMRAVHPAEMGPSHAVPMLCGIAVGLVLAILAI